MKRIAIDARIIATTTGRYVERLVHYLEELDHTNEYLILVRKADLDYYKPRNPNFSVVEADYTDYSFNEQIGFNRLLRSLRVDLVHFCMPQQPLPYTKPAVTTVHDLNLLRIAHNDMGRTEQHIKKKIFAILLWLVAHRTKRIITPSKFTRDDLVQFAHINPQKVTVTYEGADTATAKPKPVKLLANVPFILYVGRAEPYKNNRGLIKAHQALLKTHPNLHVVFAGKIDDQRKADIAWLQQQGYKNVDMLGFVSDEELAWLYQNCQAYVFPSFMEGFGLPGLEAMGYGAAVVSSNATCLPEVYGNGAHYFDPHKPGDMAQAINDVLTDENLRHALQQRGKLVHSKYSWRRMAEQTLKVYNLVLFKQHGN